MIAFVQPFGLEAPGGGARILRSLLADAPLPYVSVCTGPQAPPPASAEVHLPVRPYLGRVESTRLGPYLKLGYLTLALQSRFKARLRQLCLDYGVTTLHAIPHGLDFWFAFEVAQELGLPYILNVHDDLRYNLASDATLPLALEKLEVVWREATGRIVISEAMGAAYCRQYGARPYEVITDGLTSVAPAPRSSPPGRLQVYFMGSVHLTYEENFQCLLDALNRVASTHPDLDVGLTIRGGMPFPLTPGAVDLTVLGWGTQADVERDLDTADLLYFPLPFSPQHDAFVRYSLSTKMVTYLGSGLPVLYHGPSHAAAATLLDTHEAGIRATTRAPDELAQQLSALSSSQRTNAAEGGLRLAREQFMLSAQRRRFWGLVADASGDSSSDTISNAFRAGVGA